MLARTGVAATMIALPGCADRLGGDQRSLSISVRNQLADTQSVSIEVTSNDETVDTAEYDVPSGVSRVHELDGLAEGRYRITVASDRWKTTADWETATCGRFVVVTTLEGTDGVPHTSLSVSSDED